MKDPLQTEPTPYDVLGLPVSATAADVDAAFKQALARRVHPTKLTAAKKTLGDPVERAVTDAFLYDERVLPRLEPNPLTDIDCLSAERRAATAAAWEALLRRTFPDPGIVHALAVLSWFSAMAEAARMDKGFRPVSLGPSWELSMVLFASALECPPAGDTLAAPARQQAAERTAQKLTARVQDVAEVCRKRGDAALGAELTGLLVAFESERQAARALLAAQVRIRERPAAAGPRLLLRLGILKAMRELIGKARTEHPKLDVLARAEDALSPFAAVRHLLELDKPEAALEALQAVKEQPEALAERAALRAKARLALSRQHASVGRAEDALGVLEDAVKDAPAGTAVAREAREELIRLVQTEASARQRTDLEAAIALFERGVAVVRDDARLKLGLAELLSQHAVRRINEAQEKAGKEGPKARDTVLEAMKKSVSELEKAVALGLDKAKTQLEQVKDLLAQVQTGVAGLPREISTLVAQASEAAQAGRFDKAIELLRQAMKHSGETAKALGPLLAQILNARAVSRMNAAVKSANDTSRAQETEIKADIQSFFAGTYREPKAEELWPPLGFQKKGGGLSAGASSSRWARWTDKLKKEAPAVVGVVLLMGLGFGLIAYGEKAESKVATGIGWLLLLSFQLAPLLAGVFKWLGDAVASANPTMYAPARRYDLPNCSVAACTLGAERSIELPMLGTRYLCPLHAVELEILIKRPRGAAGPFTFGSPATELASAISDLSEATKLDPSLAQARQNLAQARELGHKLGSR